MLQPIPTTVPPTAPTPVVTPPRPTMQQRDNDQERGLIEEAVNAAAEGDEAPAFDFEGSRLQAAANRVYRNRVIGANPRALPPLYSPSQPF